MGVVFLFVYFYQRQQYIQFISVWGINFCSPKLFNTFKALVVLLLVFNWFNHHSCCLLIFLPGSSRNESSP
jgi:hypothetical protein